MPDCSASVSNDNSVLALTTRASCPLPTTQFLYLEHVRTAFLTPLKYSAWAPSQRSVNIACIKICIFTTLFFFQRKLSHTDAQKNPHRLENKTGGQ